MADEGVVAGDEPLGVTYLEGAPATGVPSAPQATFAPGTPKRVIGWATLIIMGAFGLTVLGVVVPVRCGSQGKTRLCRGRLSR